MKGGGGIFHTWLQNELLTLIVNAHSDCVGLFVREASTRLQRYIHICSIIVQMW